MADEQIIYLSPEEELTSVRERLDQVQSKRIILVIPTQTQLRSHVSWRLLHARARELNKDILIISSDRQIRSVVKAAGFRVADSLESPPSSKSRSSSRSSGRSTMGGKTSSHLKTPPGRTMPPGQSSQSRQSGQLGRRPFDPDLDPDRTDQLKRPSRSLNTDRTQSRRDNTFGSGTPPASSTFGEDEDDRQYGPPFNYSIQDLSTPAMSTPPVSPMPPLPTPPGTPSIHPLDASYQDEEPDLFLEDIERSQTIRRAAQNNDLDKMAPPPGSAISHEATPHILDLSPSDKIGNDPLLYDDDDDDAVSLPEQRGSVGFHDLDESGVDITHHTTHGMQIEDVGEQDFSLPDPGSHTSPWTGAGSQVEEDEDSYSPSRIHNLRPRASRSGKLPLPPQPQPQEEDEAALPPMPIYERPTQDMPSPQTGRRSGVLGTRDPQPIPLTVPKPMPSKPVQPPSRKRSDTGRKAPAARTTGKIPTPGRASANARQARDKKKRGGSFAIPIIVGVLIILIIGLVAFLVPSADVLVTLPSHDYPVQMSLTANATSRQDTALKTLPAQTLTFDTSVTGTGHATGSTTVGTIQADGNVTFTNNDKNNQVIIPSNTIVATKSGVQFVTQAEALVLPGSPVVVPVKAQSAGATGNVPAASITVLPASSLTFIQQANPSGTTVNLSVTNTAPTTHGGAGTATSLTTADVNTEKAALDIQIQAKVNAFLATNVHTGDQTGQPISVETPVPTPAVGSVVTNGTFTETLKLHMTVLVVRAADLQAAAIAQMKDTLSKAKTNQALVPQQPVLLKQIKNNSPKNGSSVLLSFTAIGQVAQQVSEDIVRNLVFGKSVSDAQQTLVGKNGIPGVTHVHITVNPNFFHWLPFWTQRINVHFQAVPQPTTPPKKTR